MLTGLNSWAADPETVEAEAVQGYDNGGQRYDGGNGGNSFSQPDMNDLPDAFQAVEDDIPF